MPNSLILSRSPHGAIKKIARFILSKKHPSYFYELGLSKSNKLPREQILKKTYKENTWAGVEGRIQFRLRYHRKGKKIPRWGDRIQLPATEKLGSFTTLDIMLLHICPNTMKIRKQAPLAMHILINLNSKYEPASWA